MPIDFLGRDTQQSKKKQEEYGIEMYVPEDEKESKVALEEEFKKEAESAKKLQEANLVKSLKKRALIIRLTFIVLFVIIVTGGISSYFLFFKKSPEPINENINVVIPQPPPEPPVVVQPEPQPQPEPEPEPEPEPLPPPVEVLPDTELAPLRGSLVTFSDQEQIYLVEQNGELRLVDKATTIFKNGQRINEVGYKIYKIADRFKNIRRGKDVRGQINWDPRILSRQELAPFTK